MAWLATRVLAAALLAATGVDAMSDVGWHYRGAMERFAAVGFSGTLPEYPLPAVPVIALPWLATGAVGAPDAYLVAFPVAMVAVDAIFQALLVRRVDRGFPGRWGAIAWLIGVPAQGAFVYFRFDLVPAVLLGAAVLYAVSRPGRAMTLLAFATASKLWPVLALPALLAGSRSRWRSVAVGAGWSVIIVTGCLLAADWARLVSPLTFQGRRGVEVESVWALWPLVRAVSGGAPSWSAYTLTSFSFEIETPQVLMTSASVAQFALLAALAVLWWRLWRRPGAATPAAVVWVVLASVTGFIVTNIVFSPQYLVWVLAPAAAGLSLTADRTLRGWTVGLLICAVLTQLIYPALFANLTARGPFSEAAVAVLLVRNALMLALFVVAWRQGWRCTRGVTPGAGVGTQEVSRKGV